MIGIYAKLIGAVLALGAVIWIGIAVYDAGKKAGSDAVQRLWDQDKAQLQALTAAAVAKATQERDAALQTNAEVSNAYQQKLDVAAADSAQFSSRLRNAEARLLSLSSMPTSGSGSQTTDPGSPSSAGQLGQLVTLITGLRTECKANSDQLTALIAEITPQVNGPAL
jgi:hypothetical protein